MKPAVDEYGLFAWLERKIIEWKEAGDAAGGSRDGAPSSEHGEPQRAAS